MKYLNTSEFQRDLTTAIEDQISQLVDLRAEIQKAMEQGDDANLYESAPSHQAVYHTLGTYRYVQSLIDKHTFDLHTHPLGFVCHMEGQPAPEPDHHPNGLASLLEVLARQGFSAQAVAAAAIQAIKGFDQWIMEYWEEGDGEGLADVDEYQETLRDIVGAFRSCFGTPGIGQETPSEFGAMSAIDEADAFADEMPKLKADIAWRVSHGQ